MYSVRHPARRYDREYIAYPISVFSLCVACSICRCGSGWKHGGFCFFSFPAVSMISCPIPPPLPDGKGASQSLFRRGLRPRHPCTGSPTALAETAMQVPGGGLPSRSPARPAFSFISFPHPPAPLPVGKGESQSLFRRGLRPRHPCPEPPTALIVPAKQVSDGWLVRQVAGGGGCWRCPKGGLPGWSPANLAFSFISFPHPPARARRALFPSGEGGRGDGGKKAN